MQAKEVRMAKPQRRLIGQQFKGLAKAPCVRSALSPSQASIALTIRQNGEEARVIACDTIAGACQHGKRRLGAVAAAWRRPGVYVAPVQASLSHRLLTDKMHF